MGCTVEDHKLKRGKLKGRDPLKNERMETMLKEFREDIVAYGAGDQLVCVRVCVCACVYFCVCGWATAVEFFVADQVLVGGFIVVELNFHGRGNKYEHRYSLTGRLLCGSPVFGGSFFTPGCVSRTICSAAFSFFEVVLHRFECACH